MIELHNINKSYRLGGQELNILRGLSFQIQAGEMVAIMGASGSGKTTTMNIIGLLDRPTSGMYYLNKQETSKLSSDELAQLRNETIGFIFQLFFLLPRLNALQNVGLPLTYRSMKASEIKERALISLEKVGVAHLAYHKPSEMSGGQQQRIAIARALVGNPKLIVADEPTGALDSKTGQDVMNLLLDLNEKERTTIIVVTHDHNVAKQCHRTIELVDGRVISQ